MAKKAELLAPAGDLAAGLAAIQSGADAVYAGLPRFNARERSENLSVAEFGKLTGYAHEHGRRVYLALNTLVRQDELDDIARLLEEVVPLEPDAVIVQDLGVLRLIRDYFPMLAIHASTQMGSHNREAVNLLAERGVERVILERQIPLDELAPLVAGSTIEVEVFCHGALCCCLSGTCLLSSWIGGWSGNRGRCKQPCRRRYFSKEGDGFFFSTRDLYGLEHVRELRDMGVASLKVEGRLRKSDYVEQAVTAYRMMLDCAESEKDAALRAARGVLAGAFGRSWSPGFLEKSRYDEVVDARAVGVAGQFCGKVTAAQEGGFEAAISQRLHLGDRLRVQADDGEDGVPLTVTRLSVRGQMVSRATRGETCFIACEHGVTAGDRVYRIGTQGRDLHKLVEALPEAARPVDLHVRLAADGIEAMASWGQGSATWRHREPVEAAVKHGIDEATVIDEFSRMPAAGLMIGRVTAQIDGGLFLQARQLRKFRQAFWEWAAGAVVVPPGGDAAGQAFLARREFAAPLPPGRLKWRRAVRVGRGTRPSWPSAVAVRSIYEKHSRHDEVLLPDFCPERALADLQKRVAQSLDSGVRRFRVASLYGLKILENTGHDLEITVAPPLPVCNVLAARELLAMGAARFCVWLELDGTTIETLRRLLGDRLELYVYGRPPLLTTRARLPVAGPVTDAQGNAFTIVPEGELTRLYSGLPFSLSAPEGVSAFFDLTHSRLGEKASSSFNYERGFR